ncbi:MAG: leucine-rich repeat domain-containing protein [Paludibacteraceae bacterium]|nr:leucine-rich repeat domain-containing protein [Paludibacteraceae bacterium]
MKTSSGIKAIAIIASIALLIPISINWFTFLARTISDDNDTPVNPLEYKILTDSTAAVSKCRLPEIENICIPEKVLINGNDYTVTHIGNKAFSYCRKLTNVKIPTSVTEIEYSAFSGCSSLTNFDLPPNITCINAFTFSYCTNLKSIVIPASVTSIGYKAFDRCDNLDVTIDNFEDGVEIEMDAFKGCKSVRYTN